MRRIGIIGGMSPESTALYYRLLVDGVAERLGGFESPDVLIHSVNFADIRRLQAADDWDGAGHMLANAAIGLAGAGAEALLIATNTMHRVADRVEAAVDVPLIHIADATASALKARGVHRPALFGTRKTMEMDFYTKRLERLHGLPVWVPGESVRAEIDRIIFEELVKGRTAEASREVFRSAARQALGDGADGMILGCTEIGLLVDEADLGAPTVCSARAHVDTALDFALP